MSNILCRGGKEFAASCNRTLEPEDVTVGVVVGTFVHTDNEWLMRSISTSLCTINQFTPLSNTRSGSSVQLLYAMTTTLH